MSKMFIMTVGVQYRKDSKFADERHPLGLTGNGYTIIEAPDYERANVIAHALTGSKFAFIYDSDEYTDEQLEKYHPDGEELHLIWSEESEGSEVSVQIQPRADYVMTWLSEESSASLLEEKLAAHIAKELKS